MMKLLHLQWDLAVDLAAKHDIDDVDTMLTACATKLLEENKILSAIQLYPSTGVGMSLDLH